MRTTCLFAAALWLAGIASAQAQRRIRIGPTYSSLSLEDQSGSSYSFPSYGGSVALITGDESETGLTRSEEHTSELQSQSNLVCRLLLEKKKRLIGEDTLILERKRHNLCE